MKPRLELKMAQKLVMTPQLQQAIKLLQLSKLELDQVINQEMVENPVLEDPGAESQEEEDVRAGSDNGENEAPSDQSDDFDLKWENYYLDDDRDEAQGGSRIDRDDERPSYEQTLAKSTSLVDHLLWQLGLSMTSERDRKIGTAIIGEIDENGYLVSPLEEIAASLNVSLKDVERVLTLIQEFDPLGVGARNLKECLQIQVRQIELSGSLVETIINDYLPDLEKKRYQNIAKSCGETVEEVLQAARVIEHLEPKPGRPYFSSENVYIRPDLYVVKSEGKFVVTLNDDGLPKLKISPYYRSLLRSKGTITDSTKTYLEEKFRSALWLVRSIEQRNHTIQLVGDSIVKFQQAFLEKGVRYLKPLILRQVADDISMHESTVSRVTTNKYMHTPQGIYELKFFFNTSLPRIGNNDENLSSIAVREMIRKMVSEEEPSRPLKDQEIVERLKTQNIGIARRTVTKYRSWLNIEPANRRKRPC
ncbi:MAG: RNA polymerase factor sigma-54 [Nitrospiria bacterium]